MILKKPPIIGANEIRKSMAKPPINHGQAKNYQKYHDIHLDLKGNMGKNSNSLKEY